MSETGSRNIILCADGTGNKGGYTPDSNVYKTYCGLDMHNEDQAQISFYDNGVGTSSNKIWRALSGALGFGFQRNVRDLYRYLAMNYKPGDKVYLFGFSRGAATVRAFLGFISTCGLVNGRELSYEKLEEYTKDAFNAYKKRLSNPKIARDFRTHPKSHGIIDIHFVGVWDTVSALGMPENTDTTGIVSGVLNVAFKALDILLEWTIWKHHFYNFRLGNNVQNAYQALALDDARTSFWPMVWNENQIENVKPENKEPVNVEQVWFAGMHSNVGGGYERQGMANVALYWMLARAADKELTLKPGFLDEQHENANVNGRLYDSRDGVAIFYRFHPREIQQLCDGKLQGEIKIHASVFERMVMRTANYAPTHLPRKFEMVYSELDAKPRQFDFRNDAEWSDAADAVDRSVTIRKVNYIGMIVIALMFVGLLIWTWLGHVDYWGRSGIAGHLADTLDYFTPQIFENLIEISIMRYPLITLSAVIVVLLFWRFNEWWRGKTLAAAIRIRGIVKRQLETETTEREAS